MSENGQQHPLPRRANPSPCEDLPSLLRRTAHKMGYEDPRWILHPQKSEYALKERDIPLLSKAEDYGFLSQLLFLLEETIYQHTLHRFASFSHEELLLFAIKLKMLLLEDTIGEGLVDQRDLALETVTFHFFHWLFLAWPSHLFAFLDLLYGVSSPPFKGEQHARVGAYSARLFDDVREPWLQQAYRSHLQQFRYDARRTQDFREAMNTLARSFHA